MQRVMPAKSPPTHHVPEDELVLEAKALGRETLDK
jgi:hypothetical protein